MDNLIWYILICFLFALLSYVIDVFDLVGASSAFLMGLVICISTDDVFWLLTLLSFVVLGAVVTRYKYREKEQRGLSEKNRGIRSIGSVLGNGLIPSFIALVNIPISTVLGTIGGATGGAAILFVTAVSAASADTFASEIGVFSKKTYLITHPRQSVHAGTEGGVSVLGQFSALFGAALIAGIGYLFLDIGVTGALIAVAMGFVSCQMDSVLGATLETQNLIQKQDVNFISVALGVTLAAGLVLLL